MERGEGTILTKSPYIHLVVKIFWRVYNRGKKFIWDVFRTFYICLTYIRNMKARNHCNSLFLNKHITSTFRVLDPNTCSNISCTICNL